MSPTHLVIPAKAEIHGNASPEGTEMLDIRVIMDSRLRGNDDELMSYDQ